MRAPILAAAGLLVGLATSLASCGFDAHPKSGTVACNPGGPRCCPDGYLCVGRSPAATGTCWSENDLPPDAVATAHDYTPTVRTDPACSVTDWLPPVSTGGVGGTIDAGPGPEGGPGGAVGNLDVAAVPDTVGPPTGPEAGDAPLGDVVPVGRDVAGESQVPPIDAPVIDGGGQDGTSIDGGTTVVRRMPLPCGANVPTGFCMVSDSGDWVGGGKRYASAGTAAVKLWSDPTQAGLHALAFGLTDSKTGTEWDARFGLPSGRWMVPGLYTGAQRFSSANNPGMDVSGDGRGCNDSTGKFSVEELQRDPGTGLVRVSLVFEHHCEGGIPALRGVINYQAVGTPDPTPAPDRTIPLTGKVSRVVYEPTQNVVYGIDATNHQFSRIDLATGTTTTGPRALQTPNATCVDTKRGRLFVVDKGSSFITEYAAVTLAAVRDIAWGGTDADPEDSEFRIYCGADRLYVTDAKYNPGLWTIEGLDTTTPTAVDHGTNASGVGAFALNKAGTDLYYAYQPYWGDCSSTTYVRRLDTVKFAQVDKSATNLASFPCGPTDSALLLDETRRLVFVRNRIFDATNLTRVVYTLPSIYDTFDGLAENVYAIDVARGLLATKNYVFELVGYTVVAATLTPPADQLFFDNAGTLWTLTVAESALKAQIIRR